MKEHRRRPGRGMPFRNAASTAKGVDWRATVRAFVVLVVLVAALGGIAAYSVVSRGLSAHDEPSRVEAMLAGAMRRWATPESVRSRSNPVEPTEAVLEQATAHYADHCATCHANNGSGETIERCHRSKSAEIYIGGGVNGLNLACSGAETATDAGGDYFKPGIDFYNGGRPHRAHKGCTPDPAYFGNQDMKAAA